MRGAGKKTKKNKGTVLSLNTFLGDAPQGTVNVIKKLSNNDGAYSDDDDSNATTTAVMFQLPTAPKAKRVFDDDSIPHKPPFLVRISNLPFDADEDDVYELFGDLVAKTVTLPRDDGDTGRLRGFGKVELENRDDLIHMLSLPEPTIRGRRIRIELFNQADYAGNRAGGAGGSGEGNRRHYNNFGDNDANRESTNWRQDSSMGAAGNWSTRDRETTNNSNRESTAWRRNSPEASTSRSSNWTQRTYRDDGADDKATGSRNSNWTQRTYRDDGADDKATGSSNWRQESTERNPQSSSGSWRTGTGGNSAKNADFSAWRDRDDGGQRRRNYGSRYDRSPPRDRQWQRRNSPTEEYGQGNSALNDDERPRLKLLPRQLPLPNIITSGETEVGDNAALHQELDGCNIKTDFTASTSTAPDADSGHDSDDVAVADEAV